MDLKKYLTAKKNEVDEALENYFEKLSCPAKLKESMVYSLSAGGKRLRPILVIAAAEACGGSSKDVMPIALALEMIHTFSLIHDDLPAMDDDDLRRGMPTNHVKFGEAIAILAGDGLISEAFSCLARFVGAALCGRPNRAGTEPLPYNEIIRDIADATGARGMVGGQVLDLEAEGKKVSLEELENIHKGKTGALIIVSLTSGAKAVDADITRLRALEKYGEKIGLAFQIADDILDIEGDEKDLGKPIGSDIENEKSTYPAILGLDKSKQLAKKLINEAIEALSSFDSKADPLREIAKYIINRKN